MPLPQAQQVAAGQGGAAAAAATGQTVYFLTENLFGACDDLAVVQDILARLANGSPAGSLSQVAAYQMVMKRCAADAARARAQHPLVHLIPWATPRPRGPPPRRKSGARARRSSKSCSNQGYTAFQGVGGHVDVSADGYQILHRTAVYAPPPYTESMKMFVFPNGKDFTPQALGRPRHCRLLHGLRRYPERVRQFRPLVRRNHGRKRPLEADPRGHEPRIPAVRRSISARSSSPTSGSGSPWSADYNLPITTTSERLLWAIETKDEAAVAKAIEKCVKNDPTIKKREIAGHVVWEIVEEEDTGVPQLKVDVPTLTPKKDDGKAKPDEKDDDQEKESHFLPHGAITVAYGQLFIASHIDFLVKTLKPLDEKQPPGHATGVPAGLGPHLQQAGREAAVVPQFRLDRPLRWSLPTN